jgi:hypothetical protein
MKAISKNVSVDSKSVDPEIDNEGEEDDGEDEIRLDGAIHESIPITFEFSDMRVEQTEGICLLLRGLLSNPTDAYRAACSITAQTVVGTVVCCEGENDVFALATVLPVVTHADDAGGVGKLLKGVEVAAAELVSKGGAGAASGQRILDALSEAAAATTGLFLHVRISNLPLGLVSPMHRNLQEDLAWAREQQEGDFTALSSLLLLSRGSLSDSCDLGKGAVDVTQNSAVLFDCFDDEIMAQEAVASILYRPSHSSGSPVVASLVPLATIPKAVQAITELVPAASI